MVRIRSGRIAWGPAPARRGWALVEWLVGLAIGLWLSAAALEFFLLARGAESEQSQQLQLSWQARHAMDAIGQQLRLAGSTTLRPLDAAQPAAEQKVVFSDGLDADGAGAAALAALWGQEGGAAGPDLLELSHRAGEAGGTADCLGQTPPSGATRVQSRFWLSAGVLRCLGSGNPSAQPLSNDVEDLQFLYWLRVPRDGAMAQQLLRADQIGVRWSEVDAVEVCLHLAAMARARPDPAAAPYQGCEQALPADGRVHVVLRQTFRLRGRGGFL